MKGSYFSTGIKLLALVLACVVLAAALLTAVWALPLDEAIHRHLVESAPGLYAEGTSPSLMSRLSTMLDNQTDALMLLIAGYQDQDAGPLEKAMMAYYHNGSDGFTVDYLYDSLYNGQESQEPVEYSRYWHGYLLFLRPALSIFSYQELRVINLYVQTGLVAAIALLGYRRGGLKEALPFLLLVLMQAPATTSCSLQNSSLYYIYLTALLVLALGYPWLRKKGLLPYLFCLCGIATAFLDLLTYPLVSFGVPMAYILSREDESFKAGLLRCLGLGACWALGYGGMWAGKWVLAGWVTGLDVMGGALSIAAFRLGGQREGFQVDALSACLLNLRQILKNPAFLLALAGAAFSLAAALLPGLKVYCAQGRRGSRLCLLLLALLPFLWYCTVKNHSVIHARYFTWRELLITGYALACWAAGALDLGPAIAKAKDRLTS